MARTVPEWIAKHDDQKVPDRVRQRVTVADVFDRIIPVPHSGCWIWLEGRNGTGYGCWPCDPRRNKLAHRVSYEAANGEIPVGMVVCHKCDVPSCVNPDHLFLGIQADNVKDMTNKGRGKPPASLLGEKHHSSVVTKSIVQTMRRSGKSYRQLSAEYGLSKSSVAAIMTRKTWKHVP